MQNTSQARDNYPTPPPDILPKYAQVDILREAIDRQKGRDSALWNTIVNRLRTDWTYNSCGIEGSTLTRGETHFFLSEGLTVEGKPFKDFLDAQNHAEAIDLLFDVVANKQPITEGLIKEVNALLLRGVASTPARTLTGQFVRKPAHPGQYKTAPNHVLKPDGTVHYYADTVHVPAEVEHLIAWVNESIDQVHPIHVAAVAHYNMVRIHPFDDGNGRGARFLMNLILLHKGHFPAVVQLQKKRQYLEALSAADSGDMTPFLLFIADTVIATKQGVLDVLEGRSVTHDSSTSNSQGRPQIRNAAPD